MGKEEKTPDAVTSSSGGASERGRDGLDRLMPLVYDELRRLAASFLRRERRDHTLQPTALVNEAYMRLVDQHAVSWENRAQFFGLAAQMMRRILVNHAQARRAEKRGGGATRITLDPSHAVSQDRTLEVLAVDEALEKLAGFDPFKARLVELRIFAGLTMEEAATVLEKSKPTLEREWRIARAWLHKELES
ncbi:MAG TPA: sigma-70 family RNA polymerase sigma factor [Vicinamibacteria bacterium]|nr:sigma-70 family RNA polymerase sigma factor [Vicinamibacteria bacterium]